MNENLESLWEMVNLSPNKTGINACVFVSSNMGRHDPRIKVGLNSSSIRIKKCISITISSYPEVVAGDIKSLGSNGNKIVKLSIQ